MTRRCKYLNTSIAVQSLCNSHFQYIETTNLEKLAMCCSYKRSYTEKNTFSMKSESRCRGRNWPCSPPSPPPPSCHDARQCSAANSCCPLDSAESKPCHAKCCNYAYICCGHPDSRPSERPAPKVATLELVAKPSQKPREKIYDLDGILVKAREVVREMAPDQSNKEFTVKVTYEPAEEPAKQLIEIKGDLVEMLFRDPSPPPPPPASVRHVRINW